LDWLTDWTEVKNLEIENIFFLLIFFFLKKDIFSLTVKTFLLHKKEEKKPNLFKSKIAVEILGSLPIIRILVFSMLTK